MRAKLFPSNSSLCYEKREETQTSRWPEAHPSVDRLIDDALVKCNKYYNPLQVLHQDGHKAKKEANNDLQLF